MGDAHARSKHCTCPAFVSSRPASQCVCVCAVCLRACVDAQRSTRTTTLRSNGGVPGRREPVALVLQHTAPKSLVHLASKLLAGFPPPPSLPPKNKPIGERCCPSSLFSPPSPYHSCLSANINECAHPRRCLCACPSLLSFFFLLCVFASLACPHSSPLSSSPFFKLPRLLPHRGCAVGACPRRPG